MRKYVKRAAMIINALIVSLGAVIIYLNQILPSKYYVTEGGNINLPLIVEAAAVSSETEKTAGTDYSRSELRLLGLIPIKTVNIQQIEAPVLIPCGEPFGIKLLTDGVIVVEVSSFETENGFKSPAFECGIRTGDIIRSINGKSVNSNSEVEKIVSESGGKSLSVHLLRDGNDIVTSIKPQKCASDGKFRAGIWVRDSSAGIGTITFFDPSTNRFAGLGHPVCDVDTGKLMPLLSGEAVKVSVNGVKKGRSGVPGELIGGFLPASSIGTLEMNTQTGLYGVLYSCQSLNEALPLASRQEVKTGKAYIYATSNGIMPEKYEIEIEKIDLSESEESKNMIIRVTDKKLLEETGGIVQGMSGSPIIQNDKLIGAVTHVFVNNPAKGYAIFADTMYTQMLMME